MIICDAFFQGGEAASGAPSRRDEGRQTDRGNWNATLDMSVLSSAVLLIMHV